MKFLFTVALCLLLALVTVQATTNEGKAWLKAKGQEEGVVTLPSGLLYKIIKSGRL